MLKCTPQSIFSRDYSVSGLSVGVAQLTFERFYYQGAIAFGDTKLRVRKEGWITPRWTLEHDGKAIAVAKKRSMFSRRLDVTCREGPLLLKPQTPITRGYEVVRGDVVVGVFEHEHLLTRNASAKFEPMVSEDTQLFCIWLIAMVWEDNSG